MAVVPADLPSPLDVHPDAQFWIDAATTEIDAAKWLCAGKDPDEGIILLASHYLTIVGPAGGGVVLGGLVTNESRGGVSLTVTHGAAADGAHGSTSYGMAYDAILAGICARRRTRLPPPPQPA